MPDVTITEHECAIKLQWCTTSKKKKKQESTLEHDIEELFRHVEGNDSQTIRSLIFGITRGLHRGGALASLGGQNSCSLARVLRTAPSL